jgi:hypothetical protein
MQLDRRSRRVPITASPLPNLALVCVMRPALNSFNVFLKLVELDGFAAKLAVRASRPIRGRSGRVARST